MELKRPGASAGGKISRSNGPAKENRENESGTLPVQQVIIARIAQALDALLEHACVLLRRCMDQLAGSRALAYVWLKSAWPVQPL